MKFAVLASGYGSNLQAIINAIKKKKIKADLKLVISDKPNAYALKRAQRAGIQTVFINPKGFADRNKFDKEILKYLKQEKIDFVVLAGYMRILGSHFVKKYSNKILNVHPALLPSFKGAHGIRDAYNYGAKVTGVTIHFVNEDVDMGPVMAQESIAITSKDTLETLEKKIHRVEHRLLPKMIDLFARGKLTVKGRKVFTV